MGWFNKDVVAATPLHTPMPVAPVAAAPPMLEAPKAKASPPPAPSTPNTIAEGTTVRGDLRGAGGFCIDGRVDGSIESTGPVIVGKNGSVSGLIRGTHVTIEGAVQGDVYASGHLEIGAAGRLVGDATAKSVRVADGGVFHGMSRMGVDALAESEAAAPSSPLFESPIAISGERWATSDARTEDDAAKTGTEAE